MGRYTKYLENIGAEALKELLKENYTIIVDGFSPIYSGEIGESYIVSSGNKKYFLKILLKEKVDHIEDLDASLTLTLTLKENGVENIAYPIKSLSGELKINHGDYYLVLSNYINAKGIDSPSREDMIKIATIVAKVHSLPIENVKIKEELYHTDYADLLLKHLNAAENEKDVWSQRVRDLLLPYKPRLQTDLEHLRDVSVKAQAGKKTNVITHGDLILDNVLKSEDGQIYIVDWDSARLAPPERDLWFFVKDYASEFLPAYKKFGNKRLDINIISFFLYKRYLEDMVYWLDEILNKNVPDEQKMADLEGIQVSFLDAYENIDDILKKFRQNN